MSKISWKPGTMLFPLPPVMITSGTMEKPNVMTVAWTGIVNSEPPMTYISVRPSRHSHAIIKEAGEFVINITTLELAKACDYCGIKSGKNTDKFADMGLEIEPCKEVQAPMLVKAPVSLECKVKSVTNYGTHDMFLADIVNVNIDDKYLEDDERLALEKAGLLAFAHGRYYTLGRDLGAFGFSVDQTKENKTKPRKSKFQEVLEVEKQVKEGVERIREHAPRERRDDRSGGAGRTGERRPYNRDGGGERRAPRGDGGAGRTGGGRPYNRDGGGERRAPRGDGERRPYNRDGGGERRAPREDGERRPYNRDGGGERRAPRGDGERRPYNRDGGGERRAPRGDAERRPYNRDGGGERRAPRGDSERRPAPHRDGGGERRPAPRGDRPYRRKSED